MNKSILISAALLGGALAMTGCETLTAKPEGEAAKATAAAPATPATKADYEKALGDAKAAQKKAASVGGEWRDTGKLIKEAEEAAAKGDFATATKKASTAKFQGEAGYAQAMSQKSAGNPDYLK